MPLKEDEAEQSLLGVMNPNLSLVDDPDKSSSGIRPRKT